jgi:hypothetical protein
MRNAECGFIDYEDTAFTASPLARDRAPTINPHSAFRIPHSAFRIPMILDLLSIFYLVYYIGGRVALTWAGNYLTNNGDRIGLSGAPKEENT